MGTYIDRTNTLPDSANKSDFYNLVDNARPVAIADDDEDTKIQVEESTDEDKVRVDTGGSERLVIDSQGIKPAVGLGVADADGDTSLVVEETADADTIVGKSAGVEVVRVTNVGITTLAKQSSARAYLGTDQTGVATSTNTKVNLDTENWDTQGEFATSKFTATEAGKYAVSGQVTMDVGDGKALSASIYVNGALVAQATARAGAAGNLRVNVSDILNLSASDYVELYVWHNIGANGTVVSGSANTFLSVCKIA